MMETFLSETITVVESVVSMWPFKRKNVLERFQKWFDALQPKEKEDLWYLLCILRGPDEDHWTSVDKDRTNAKNSTTARLRSVILPSLIHDQRIGVMVSDPNDRAPLRADTLMLKSSSHFAMHYDAACRVLSDLGITFKRYESDKE
jgi:hypothetical protein